MKKEYDNLLKKFIEISNKKWIKGISNHFNAAGLTFEEQLGKKADNMFFPDYYGIEIKCTQRYSGYPVILFSSAFDGPSLYETNRILELYGKKDYKYPDKKILMSNLKYNEKVLIYNKYFFKITISDEEEKLYLEVYDLFDNLIEKQSFITFETLKNKLEIKLSNLAIVYASKKKDIDYPYFRYYKMDIYKLKNFETFIESIKDGTITLSILCRVSRSGLEEGRQRNKNILFGIYKKNINKLFNLIVSHDNDTSDNFQIFNI